MVRWMRKALSSSQVKDVVPWTRTSGSEGWVDSVVQVPMRASKAEREGMVR